MIDLLRSYFPFFLDKLFRKIAEDYMKDRVAEEESKSRKKLTFEHQFCFGCFSHWMHVQVLCVAGKLCVVVVCV